MTDDGRGLEGEGERVEEQLAVVVWVGPRKVIHEVAAGESPALDEDRGPVRGRLREQQQRARGAAARFPQ